MRFCLVALFLATSATAQDCPTAGSHRFYGATLRPGPDSAKLASKLAQTADYGKHGGGWLAKRLFALDDDVEIVEEKTQPVFRPSGQDADTDLGRDGRVAPQQFVPHMAERTRRVCA
jgi:hypothetical protein